MRKKASDYVIGDRFVEADSYVSGTVVSLMIDPVRPTRAFILVCSDDGAYTIYTSLRDAVGKASLSRNIPEPVLRQFLFDVYTGGREMAHVPGMTTRMPVSLPEFAPIKPPKSPPVNPDKEETVPEVTYGPAPVPGMHEEEREPERLLPEVDFP